MSGLFGGGSNNTPTPEQQERMWRMKAASKLPPSGATNPVEGKRRGTIMQGGHDFSSRSDGEDSLGGYGSYPGGRS